MSDSSLVLMEINNGIAFIQLNDPDSRNAISETMAAELVHCLKKAEQAARVVILTGVGKGFCSGAKLSGKPNASKEGDPKSVDLAKPLREVYNPLLTTIRCLSIPIVTAVNGAAAGIGYSIAVSGDIIVAQSDAKFVLAFSKIGLVPDGGATYQLVKTLGRARAMELAMLDERLTAEQALAWGLINRVVPAESLIETVTDIATRLANGPTVALGAVKSLIWGACENTFEEQVEAEAKAQFWCGKTHDHRNAVKAFLAKQPPIFEGK